MADEKNEQISKKAKAKKKRVKGSNRIAKWFREMRSELRKVVWPTPKQVVNNTWIVLVMIVAVGIMIMAFDFVWVSIIQDFVLSF